MCKWVYFVGVISCIILFCCGCNPIEDGISNAIETLILNTFSNVWNTAVISVTG